MKTRTLTAALLAMTFGTVLAGAARADCESDMIQLEQAMKAPNQTPAIKTAFDDAKAKSVAAMHKDDDTGCHAAIADAMGKAGMKLK